MASDTDIIKLHMQFNIMDVEEWPIKDNAGQIVDVEKDEDRKRADEDVMAMPRYNEPKKTNNAKGLSQGEIVTCFFIFGN
jgi:hypothetical protein